MRGQLVSLSSAQIIQDNLNLSFDAICKSCLVRIVHWMVIGKAVSHAQRHEYHRSFFTIIPNYAIGFPNA